MPRIATHQYRIEALASHHSQRVNQPNSQPNGQPTTPAITPATVCRAQVRDSVLALLKAVTWVIPVEPHSGKSILFPTPLKFLGTNSSSVPAAVGTRTTETDKYTNKQLALESAIVAHGWGPQRAESSRKLKCTPGWTNGNDSGICCMITGDGRCLVRVCCYVLAAYLAQYNTQYTKTIGVATPCAT